VTRIELLPLVHECPRSNPQTRCRAANLTEPLTRGDEGRNFIQSFRLWRSRSPPPSIGPRPMEALTSRRSQSTRVGHTNSFRRRITRLYRSRSSASAHGHLTTAAEHERALTRRELALRAVAAAGADRHLPELPTTEAPRAGSSSGEPAPRAAGAWRVVFTTSRHVPHSAAPPGAATNRAGGR
jgi:hypothetical protein